MNLLITGCAGFIGSHLCEKFLSQKLNVVGIDNMNTFYDPEIKKNNLIAIESTAEKSGSVFSFYPVDIRHTDQIEQIIKIHQIDAIVHLAAMSGIRSSFENPLYYVETNELGTVSLLEVCRKNKILHFINASSSSVYGESDENILCQESQTHCLPNSPYAASKLSAEIHTKVYAKNFGLKIANLRFFTVYGKRQPPDLAMSKFTKFILKGESLPVFGDGNQTQQFVHVNDAITAIQKALAWSIAQSKGVAAEFNIAGEDVVSTNNLVKEIGEYLSKTPQIQYLPLVMGDAENSKADLSYSKEVLGFSASISFKEGLKDYVLSCSKKY